MGVQEVIGSLPPFIAQAVGAALLDRADELLRIFSDAGQAEITIRTNDVPNRRGDHG